LTSELILQHRRLRIENLQFLQSLGHFDGDEFRFDHSPKGYKLKTPTSVPLERVLEVGQEGLVEFILSALLPQRPRLIRLVLENKSLLQLGDYFCYDRNGSPATFYLYVNAIARYTDWLNTSPDALLSDLRTDKGLIDMERVQKHIEFLRRYHRTLKDRKISPSRIANYVKAVRSLYRINGVDIKLPYPLPRRTVKRDRAPKPEELQRLLDVANLREKVIISMLALGGFREGTLVRLRYGHVREDLEKGIKPLHIHVEAEITKGKYHDYDTFLGEEAVEYLRQYIDARRRGIIHSEIPPEKVSDDSPLVRDEMYEVSRPIGEKQLYKIVHELYFKAGLLHKNQHGGYDLRVHSIRKFFKTQLIALGIQSDYVDYMMGHTVDTYHDMQSKGIEFLRSLYANAGLCIQPKTSITPRDQLRTIARGFGLSPAEAARLLTSSEPHRIYASQQEREEHDIRVLCDAITERITERIFAKTKS
jgi:site-specific recombinase XerD